MKTPKIEYDPQVDAAYIRFSANPVVDTAEVSEGIMLDYDAEGKIVGMEVLDASAHLPAEIVEAA
ncbi:Uncharacterized protein YuzE [Ensifer adhaerens]|nr:Uncharacterized protein YuzE [Ensifer adhaerens]